jgi:uncharacterized protein YbjT (DUF2867 family)
MSKRLIVTGGDGFIGRHVCRIAVAQGHQVVSIARAGRGDVQGDWANSVEWVAANVLQPETWRDRLQGADAVIHCVGIMREHPRTGETYERINDDSTEIVAWEAEHAGVPRFVFLSADTPKQLVPDRFIEAKRRAEQSLRRSQLRESVLRPAFVYGDERPATMVGARLLQAAGHVPGLHDLIHPNRPLRVEQVALAAVRAATDEGYEGVISIDNIEYLAGNDWKGYANEPTNGHTGPLRPRNLVLGGVLAGTIAGIAWQVFRRQSGR